MCGLAPYEGCCCIGMPPRIGITEGVSAPSVHEFGARTYLVAAAWADHMAAGLADYATCTCTWGPGPAETRVATSSERHEDLRTHLEFAGRSCAPEMLD